MPSIFATPSKRVPQWFVLHVKWRKELEFAQFAETRGARTFVAKKNVLKETKTETKSRTESIVIPEIVFVLASHEEMEKIIEEAMQRHGYRIYYARDMRDGQRRIMTVRASQMESFIRIATQTQESITYLQPNELPLMAGDKVRIHGGPFDGATGTLLALKGKRGKRVVVSIEGLAAVAAAYVTPDYIELLVPANGAHGPSPSQIDDLIESSEEYTSHPDPNKLAALRIMAQRLTSTMVNHRTPSADMALLVYAHAVGDNQLAEKQCTACKKHIEQLHDSHLRRHMMEMVEKEMTVCE